MATLILPFYPFKLKEINKKVFILDEIRKKYLVLTPEEWVRQHFIQYLIRQRSYPKGLIKIESGLTVNTLKKRSDILIMNHDGGPFMLVECKASTVKLNQRAIEQASSYNIQYKAENVVVTNGLEVLAFKINHECRTFDMLKEIPNYPYKKG